MINWGLLVLILYALYYTALEPVAGLSWGVLLGVPMWLTANAFYKHVPHAWAWALGLHILSWFLQVRVSFCILFRDHLQNELGTCNIIIICVLSPQPY